MDLSSSPGRRSGKRFNFFSSTARRTRTRKTTRTAEEEQPQEEEGPKEDQEKQQEDGKRKNSHKTTRKTGASGGRPWQGQVSGTQEDIEQCYIWLRLSFLKKPQEEDDCVVLNHRLCWYQIFFFILGRKKTTTDSTHIALLWGKIESCLCATRTAAVRGRAWYF